MTPFLKQFFLLSICLPLWTAKNQLKAARIEDGLKYSILLGFAGGVAWAEYVFFARFWSLLETVPMGFALLAPRFFSLIGSFTIVFLSYSSFLTAMSSFYRSSDLPFLLSSPVRIPLALFMKWNDVALRSGATLIFLAFPPMVSLAVELSLAWPFYVGYTATTLAFSALGVSLGVWLAMGMAAIFPVKRMHQTAAILGLCIAVLAITGLRFLHVETLWSEQALANPLILFLQQYPAPFSQYAPGQLFANAIIPFIVPENSLTDFWLILAAGVLSVILTTTLSRRLFLRGWRRSQEQCDPEVRASLLMAARKLSTARTSRFATLLWKDWLIFTRDPSIWTQLFMMIPLAALYLLNLSFLPLKGDELLPFFAAANVGLIGLIVAAIGARFLFPSASREGRAVWIPLTSPVPARKMIAQKILFNLPPVMLLSLLLLIGASQIMRLSPGWAIWSLVYGFALSFLIGLLALFLGFCFPTYSYRHLMEISLGKGAFLFMIVALVQIISFEYITIRQLLIDPQSPLSPFNRDLFFWFAAWVFWVWFCYRAGKRRWAISPDRDQ